MAEVVTATAAGVAAVSKSRDLFLDPLRDKVVYSNDMKKIYGDLIDEMEKLQSKRDDHEKILQRHRATMGPSKTYNNWIHRITRIEAEVEEIKSKYETKSQQSRLWFLTRSKFSEKMKTKSSEIVKLIEEGKQLGDILVEKEPDHVVKMIAPDIKEFSTLQKPLEQILYFLSNNEVSGIRVHGMVGIGKTSIMQNLNNHKKVAEMFEIVIWLRVSTEEDNKNLSTEQIQQAIVRRLKINMEGINHSDEVANRIREELRDKKYLLLLDDVKEDLKLNEIGIDHTNENGVKIVLTTRFGHVCHSIVNKVIKVGKFSPKEAWKMFQNVLGNSKLKENPNIERLMYQVVQFCDGLPFVIKMVASAFKMRNTEERWSDGLNNLRKWPKKGDNVTKEMYKLLNFCCDYLEGAQKDCFFYSAIYPEDSDIHTDCLLDCWAAEDLYGNVADAEEGRVNGRDILEHLKMVSLLEEDVCRESVRMHKLIRQVALFNLSTDDKRKHLVKTGESLRDPPSVEHWRHKTWISLVDNKLHTLPEHPDCSMLSTLFLQENPRLKRMANSFFEHMENLRVLNLDRTGIATLPTSLAKLICLRVLYLNGCTDLKELPSQIGELEHLEVLDIRGSSVKNIPHNTEKLNHLRRLLVSFTNFLNENDTQNLLHNCHVISKISTLEELIVDVKSDKQRCSKMLNMVRDNVTTVTKLKTLKFYFKDGVVDVIKEVAATPKFHVPKADDLTSFAEKIDDPDSKSFQVFIGCPISSPLQIPKIYRYQRYLKYCNGEGCNPTISRVLAKTDAFELVKHNDLEHVSNFGTSNMVGVRCCLIESCNKIRAIMNANCTMDIPMLPNLEQLYIKKLPELESIWKGPMQLGSFFKLRTLEIEECFGIEELLVEPGNARSCPCFLQNLRKLILVDMPNLRRICPYESFEWPALEKLKIYGCPSLTELPFNKDNAVKLKSIEAEKKWWEALQFQDPDVKKQLQPCCSLRFLLLNKGVSCKEEIM